MTSTTAPDRLVNLEEPVRRADSIWRMTLRRFFRHRMAVFGLAMLTAIVLFVTVGALFLTEEYANDTDIMNKYAAPSTEHPFGTDQVGRDILARCIYGGQISLVIGILSMFISVTLGTLVGLIAGYFGGVVDAVLMRVVEAMLAIPTLVLLLLLARSLSGNTTIITAFGRQLSITAVAIVVIIGLTSWMGLARVVRSMVLTLKEQEFIHAAHMIGASRWRIVFSHVLPNCIAPVVVAATLGVGNAIIIEAYLSFLGYGVRPPTATWGNILERAQDYLDDYWWMWLAPGTLIILTSLAINFIGDGLRDALDPRMRR